jgi:heterodisulfide reductase subunit B
MSKSYTFYPGCSSQPKASGSNQQVSVAATCDALDITLNDIPDWNCCGASIGYAGGGELPRIALSARNIALAEQANPGQDIVASCPACWLATREAKERLEHSETLRADAVTALAEGGLEYKGEANVRHLTEVLIEDIGYEGMASKVIKPLEGIKVASYVGCQANRPYGIDGESYENPLYLDKMSEAMGAEAMGDYQKKAQCCGGALNFSEPEKSQALVRDILEAAYDCGAEMIVTPCAMCQMNTEAFQEDINKTYGTNFNIPVVYYSQMMAVAYGKSAKEAGLDQQIIRATRLEEIAAK